MRTTARMLAATLTLAGAAACSSIANLPPERQASSVSASVKSDADILGVLHQSNAGEVAASQLAQQRATDAEARSFAGMMVTQHTDLDRFAAGMAAQWKIEPSLGNEDLQTVQQEEMRALGAVTGAAFDRAFVAQQIAAHQRTLSIVDVALAAAQHSGLRNMLRDQVRPAVAAHLQMAQGMAGRLGAPTGAP